MARRRGYNNRNNYRGRKVFLWTVFLTIILLVVWKYVLKKDILPQKTTTGTVTSAQNDTNDSNSNINKEKVPAQQPKSRITLPKPEVIDIPNGSNKGKLEPSGTNKVKTADKKTEPKKLPAARKTSQAEIVLQQGEKALGNKEYVRARSLLSRAIEMGLPDAIDRQARELVNKCSDKWLFSSELFAGDKICTTTKTNRYLSVISKEFGTPFEFICRINNIKDANRVPSNRTIKVVNGPFHVKVWRARCLMSLYIGDIMVRSYQITVGKVGRETPLGNWKVKLRQPDPSWTDKETGKTYEPGDPENPLGKYWIGLTGLDKTNKHHTDIGIHGTIKPEEIGKAASRGCVRLRDVDIDEVYNILYPGKTLVKIVK